MNPSNKSVQPVIAVSTDLAAEKSLSLIPAIKVAKLKLALSGVKQRKKRLEEELTECRNIIRKKYKEVRDKQEKIVGHIKLGPDEIFGFKLQQTQIEKKLALVKQELLFVKRDYREAIGNNLQAVRKEVKEIKKKNQVLRQSKKLLGNTTKILIEHGSNGGAIEFNKLKEVAKTRDIKAFRSTFDEVLQEFDPAHHVTISGLCTVKTEIIHSVMEQLADPTSTISNIGQIPMIDSIEV